MGAATSQGMVQKLLPTPNLDDPQNPKNNRYGRYGEQFALALMSTTDHELADEGAYFVATNTAVGTGQTWVAAQTAFSDTAPNFYIFNPEAPANPLAKSIYLRFLKLISTAVATSTTLIRYSAILDNIPRAPTTDNMLAITPVCPNGAISTLPMTPTIKVQNSATASVVPASSASKRIVANGTWGGLNVVGTELQVNFGSTDAGGGQNGVAAETIPNRRVNNDPPIIIPPGYSCIINVWLVGSSASPAPEWTLAGWIR